MSFFSQIWQSAKGTVAGIVSSAASVVPFIGAPLGAKLATQIAGSGSNGQPNTDPALQAEADRNAYFAQQEADRIRMNAATAAARIGAGVTQQVAGAIGPPGNFYQTGNPFAYNGEYVVIGIVALIALVLFSRGK